MSDCPQELHYTESHEWVRLEQDETVVIGITDYAQHQLGDLVFVELPKVGKLVEAGEETVVLESVKTAADVYAPLSGEIVENNEQLEAHPDLINSDPYGEGWIYRLKLEDITQLDQLMSAQAYQNHLAQES